jgi:hypothetical protein
VGDDGACTVYHKVERHSWLEAALYWRTLYSPKVNNTKTLICLFKRQISVGVNSSINVGWAITFSVKDKNVQCHRRSAITCQTWNFCQLIFSSLDQIFKGSKIRTPHKTSRWLFDKYPFLCLTVGNLFNCVFISFQMTNKWSWYRWK